MIECFRYSRKEVKKIGLSKINFLRDTSLIDLSIPSDKEIKDVSNKTKIEIRDLNYVLKDANLSSMQVRRNYFFLIFKKPNKNKISNLGIFISRNFIVTVHSKKSDAISNMLKISKKNDPSVWFSRGVPYLSSRVLMEVVRQFSNAVLDISRHVEKFEDKMFKRQNFAANAKDLFFYKKSLLFYRDALIKNRDVVEDIHEGASPFIAGKSKEYYLSVKGEISEVISVLDMVTKTSQDAMDVAMGLEANKLNAIMRTFTIIASFILIPTLISGIWGMNFANIPFFDNVFGFYFPIVLMVFSIIILFIVFKAKKWM